MSTTQTPHKNPFVIFFIYSLTFILVYYIIVLLHEWGHGTTAWLFGYKASPFDVQYGGFLLLHCDEAVPYDQILASGQGLKAALIGISGMTVTTVLFLLSLYGLNKKCATQSLWLLSSLYWSLVLNMMAIFGYIPLDTFSTEGDVGRFIHGLNISPWLIFIPGTILVFWGLHRMFHDVIIKVYVYTPIKTMTMQRILLLISLMIIFLLLYTHGYNPFSDSGTNTFSKVLAGISILLVPIIFIVCNPSKNWVQLKAESLQNKPR